MFICRYDEGFTTRVLIFSSFSFAVCVCSNGLGIYSQSVNFQVNFVCHMCLSFRLRYVFGYIFVLRRIYRKAHFRLRYVFVVIGFMKDLQVDGMLFVVSIFRFFCSFLFSFFLW